MIHSVKFHYDRTSTLLKTTLTIHFNLSDTDERSYRRTDLQTGKLYAPRTSYAGATKQLHVIGISDDNIKVIYKSKL